MFGSNWTLGQGDVVETDMETTHKPVIKRDPPVKSRPSRTRKKPVRFAAGSVNNGEGARSRRGVKEKEAPAKSGEARPRRPEVQNVVVKPIEEKTPYQDDVQETDYGEKYGGKPAKPSPYSIPVRKNAGASFGSSGVLDVSALDEEDDDYDVTTTLPVTPDTTRQRVYDTNLTDTVPVTPMDNSTPRLRTSRYDTNLTDTVPVTPESNPTAPLDTASPVKRTRTPSNDSTSFTRHFQSFLDDITPRAGQAEKRPKLISPTTSELDRYTVGEIMRFCKEYTQWHEELLETPMYLFIDNVAGKMNLSMKQVLVSHIPPPPDFFSYSHIDELNTLAKQAHYERRERSMEWDRANGADGEVKKEGRLVTLPDDIVNMTPEDIQTIVAKDAQSDLKPIVPDSVDRSDTTIDYTEGDITFVYDMETSDFIEPKDRTPEIRRIVKVQNEAYDEQRTQSRIDFPMLPDSDTRPIIVVRRLLRGDEQDSEVKQETPERSPWQERLMDDSLFDEFGTLRTNVRAVSEFQGRRAVRVTSKMMDDIELIVAAKRQGRGEVAIQQLLIIEARLDADQFDAFQRILMARLESEGLVRFVDMPGHIPTPGGSAPLGSARMRTGGRQLGSVIYPQASNAHYAVPLSLMADVPLVQSMFREFADRRAAYDFMKQVLDPMNTKKLEVKSVFRSAMVSALAGVKRFNSMLRANNVQVEHMVIDPETRILFADLTAEYWTTTRTVQHRQEQFDKAEQRTARRRTVMLMTFEKAYFDGYKVLMCAPDSDANATMNQQSFDSSGLAGPPIWYR